MNLNVFPRRVIRLYSFVSFGLIIALQWSNTGVSAHFLPHLNIGLGNDRRQPGNLPGENDRIDRTPLISSPLGSLTLITGEKKNGAINCDPNTISHHQNAPDRNVIGINIHIGPQRYPNYEQNYATASSLPPECNPQHPSAVSAGGTKQPEPNTNLQPVSPPYFANKPLISSTTDSIPVSSSSTTTTTTKAITFSTGFESNSNAANTSTGAADADVDKLIGDVFGNANNADSERNNENSNTNGHQTNPEITGEGVLDIRMPKSN